MKKIKIDSKEDLKIQLKYLRVYPTKELILGEFDEFTFVKELKNRNISYRRIGFKKWQISRKISTNTQIILRLITLIISFLFIIILTFRGILNFWLLFEKYFVTKPVLSSIIASIIVGFFIGLFKKFKNKIVLLLNFYLL